MITIGILALQGAFVEHARVLDTLGVSYVFIRQKKDLDQTIDGLIMPGGESTTMSRLLHDLGLFTPIRKRIEEGFPIFGTCAGLILLAKQLEGNVEGHFRTLDVTVRRNAYGRQLASFMTKGTFNDTLIDMIFIRAPLITSAGPDTHILAIVDKEIVAIRQGNQLGCSFHPELSDDTAVHTYFLNMVESHKKRGPESSFS